MNEKTLTVKEFSDVLGVSEDLIKKRIRELYPDKMINGKTTYLNEKEVTAITLRIKQNSSLATCDDRNRLADMPMTELEKKLLIQQAWNFLQEDIRELQTQNYNLIKKIEQNTPKVELYDLAMDSTSTIAMSDVCKVLNLGFGRNELFRLLREKKILDRSNRPMQRYVNTGYFKIIENVYEQNGQTFISLKTVVFQKGLNYIWKIVQKKEETIPQIFKSPMIDNSSFKNSSGMVQ